MFVDDNWRGHSVEHVIVSISSSFHSHCGTTWLPTCCDSSQLKVEGTGRVDVERNALFYQGHYSRLFAFLLYNEVGHIANL